ncbi:MAG: hypothetical protein M3N52_09535, partial [Actinomycetota bacterium]|nr:hypothetical protein [Actinomycetota bacterium]
GAAVLAAARSAFVDGMQVAAGIGAAMAVAAAAVTSLALRNVRPSAPEPTAGSEIALEAGAGAAGMLGVQVGQDPLEA